MNENELTYSEVIQQRISKAIAGYKNEVEPIIRNIKLNTGDIENDILQDQFFNRTDISKDKIDILLQLTVTLNDKLKYINS